MRDRGGARNGDEAAEGLGGRGAVRREEQGDDCLSRMGSKGGGCTRGETAMPSSPWSFAGGVFADRLADTPPRACSLWFVARYRRGWGVLGLLDSGMMFLRGGGVGLRGTSRALGSRLVTTRLSRAEELGATGEDIADYQSSPLPCSARRPKQSLSADRFDSSILFETWV